MPQFNGLEGWGNTFTMALTMPLPKYRLLPLPQLSLLTIPAAVTLPGDVTALGDLRFLDLFNEYGVQIMTPAYEGDPESPR